MFYCREGGVFLRKGKERKEKKKQNYKDDCTIGLSSPKERWPLVTKAKERKVYKMILSLSCSVTLSYSLSHSFSCAGFYKFVVRDDVISPAGVRNFGTYDDVFEHVHSVARVRKNWATVVANKSGCANGPEAP